MRIRTALYSGLGAVALAGAIAVGFALYPQPLPAQPVPFSHAHHAGDLGLDCRFCHYMAEHGPRAGVPSMDTCAGCHYPVEARPVAEPLRWLRQIRLPDFAHFDHSIHLSAGVGCSTCHGRVDRMERIEQPQAMTMLWCLECHRDPAPHLRPPDRVAAMDWTPPGDQREAGRARMAAQGIEPTRLTHCHVCHR